MALTGGAAARSLVVGRQPKPGARAEIGPLPRTPGPPAGRPRSRRPRRPPATGSTPSSPGWAGVPRSSSTRSDRRATALVTEGRHAAAALARTQVADLVAALERQRRIDAVRRADRLVLGLPGGGRAELVRGRLVRTWHADRSSTLWSSGALPPGAGPLGGVGDGPPAAEQPPGVAPLAGDATPGGLDSGRAAALAPAPAQLGQVRLDGVAPPAASGPLAAETADELLAVAAWLDDHASAARLLYVEGELASSFPRLPPAGDEPPEFGTVIDDPRREEPLRCAPC